MLWKRVSPWVLEVRARGLNIYRQFVTHFRISRFIASRVSAGNSSSKACGTFVTREPGTPGPAKGTTKTVLIVVIARDPSLEILAARAMPHG